MKYCKNNCLNRNIKKRRVYHGGDHIYKTWIKPKLTYEYLRNMVELIEKVDPSYVLDYGINNGKSWAKFRIVEGEHRYNPFKWNEESVRNVINFITNHYKTFHPIYHGDPSLGNILVSDDTFHFIDYDDICVNENINQVFKLIQDKCLEAFSMGAFAGKYNNLIKSVIKENKKLI